ncbi:unnamed protein product [Urochloa humidicola]
MASGGSQDKSLETARRLLEETSPAEAEAEADQLPSLPSGFYDAFVLKGIRVVQALQPGTLLCHFTVPSRLLEEIDIEAKVLRAGKAVGVALVELKKKSGKIIAQARYSKYLGAASSKL